MNKSIDEMIIELSEFLAFNKPTLKTTLETVERNHGDINETVFQQAYPQNDP